MEPRRRSGGAEDADSSGKPAMLYLYFFYVFMAPLEYYQDKFFPKGPPGCNYVDVAFAAMLLWWLARGKRRGRPLAAASTLNVILVVYLIDVFVGLFLTYFRYPGFGLPINPDSASFPFLIRYLNNFLFFWLAVNMIDKRRHARWALYAIGLSTFMVWRAFRSDIAGHNLAMYRDEMRMASPFTNAGSNELAALFLYVCVFFGTFALYQKRLWEKACYLLATGLYVYCLLYSYSRGSQLGCIVAILLIVAIRYRWLFVVVLIAVMTYQAWLPTSVQDRWLKTTADDGKADESVQSRQQFWQTAWDLFLEEPFAGNGVDSFIRLNPAKMDTHNIYLRVLCEQGVIGFALLAWLWGSVLRLAFQVWRGAPDPWDRQFGFALLVATVGLMVSNIFGDRFTYTQLIGQYWTLIGLCQRLHNNMTGVEPFLDAEPATVHASVPAPAIGAEAGALAIVMLPGVVMTPAATFPSSFAPGTMTPATLAILNPASLEHASSAQAQASNALVVVNADQPRSFADPASSDLVVVGTPKATAWEARPASPSSSGAVSGLAIVGRDRPDATDAK
jgi:O-antigen ligase